MEQKGALKIIDRVFSRRFQREGIQLKIDCHNHSVFSFDGSCSVEEMAAAAAKKRIGVFAVTDHCDVNEYAEQRLGERIPASLKAIHTAREHAPLRLLAGVELGQPLQDIARTEEILVLPGLDFVIGSLHNLAGEQDFYWMDYVALSDDELFFLFRRYYTELLELAEWNRFDTLAHITYPYRYLYAQKGKREFLLRPESFDPLAEQIFLILIRNQKALELNTASFRTMEEVALNRRYLEMYRDLGGELLTFGSDAHTPDRIGAGAGMGLEMAREAGFAHFVYYEKRIPVQVPLDQWEDRETIE